MSIYDVSVPLFPAMVGWPGDPEFEMSAEARIPEDGYSLSRICMGTHTGTHVDAPRHVVEYGKHIDQIPLDVLIGRALVAEVKPPKGWAIQPEDLIDAGVPRGCSRVLFKTSNSDLWAPGPHDFEPFFVHLSEKTARWLVESGAKLVGIDYMSVDGMQEKPLPAHHVLLEAGVVIIENLDLSHVPPGVYDLIALPLKLLNADGAPARVVLVH